MTLFIILHWAAILQALTSVVTGASVLANFTKKNEVNKASGFFSNAVHLLAENFFALDIQPPTFNE